jgi:hypothetical protein
LPWSRPVQAANDCPSALNGKGSYILEQGANSKTEVFYGPGATIRTEFRLRDRKLLETTLYEGLFELQRIDRGLKAESKPRVDLGKFFPLKPKQKIDATFDLVSDGQAPKTRSVKLDYVGLQDFKIGDCTYGVVKFQRDETWPAVSNIDYYAPELKLVVAKEYPEKNGRRTIVGYARIYSAGR